jgi:hypothetical protein
LRRALALAASLLSVGALACKHDDSAVLLIVVTASGTPPPVTSLDVKLDSPHAVTPSTNHYGHDDQTPIDFPTTLSAQLPAYATGDLDIEVHAFDASGAMVASGRKDGVTIHGGEHRTVYVDLACGGDPCVVDGGTGNDDGGPPPPMDTCGNGRLDPEETCDTAIAQGNLGACPLSCDDHVACTRDTRAGADCTAYCRHDEIHDRIDADGCCPATAGGASAAADSDCLTTCGNRVVDKGETCDTMIPAGMPGACPTDEDCLALPCATARLIAHGSCSAVCLHEPIVTASKTVPDGCCPPGATDDVDADCVEVCGNGVKESGENCDFGIPPGLPDRCPARSADCDDGNACTIDYIQNVGCASSCYHFPIKTPVAGDGCCPPGATNATDSDCPPMCHNSVIERGETCDDACPTSCPPLPPDKSNRLGCLRRVLVGDADDCSARCAITEISTCDAQQSDECCPAGCTAANDIDCSPTCGDGVLQITRGEICESGGLPGLDQCPTSCNDSNPCTDDRLVSAGTCSARCLFIPVTEFRPGDGCCPRSAGANAYLDPDCSSMCGDGVVESPVELCDYGAGCPGPDTCPSNDVCGRYTVTGKADSCTAACVANPITACVSNDGCCAPGCTHANDSDCPSICGDGIVDEDETCDRAITAGAPGACPRTCDDGDACTYDQAAGSVEGCSRTCSHAAIAACISNDGCCPAGCAKDSDNDCAPTCGDNKIGAGETCDPQNTCPTQCPDDGDPCTAEQMIGAKETCNAACRHVPITTCSGAARDSCCPTGCTAASDSDC